MQLRLELFATPGATVRLPHVPVQELLVLAVDPLDVQEWHGKRCDGLGVPRRVIAHLTGQFGHVGFDAGDDQVRLPRDAEAHRRGLDQHAAAVVEVEAPSGETPFDETIDRRPDR